jgi:pimeloyl-ACP methyl ester carboxylesterase
MRGGAYVPTDNVLPGEIEGFARRKLPGDGLTIDGLVGGSGPPLLLLHGYPQTRMAWRAVALRLASHFTVVVPDLRGYGRSDKPTDDEAHQTYSKRAMARDQIAAMSALGFPCFFVAGHDRGARVAYRLALDEPEAVKRLCVIDIIPTADVIDAGAAAAINFFHWTFLAQPFPLPERILEGRTDAFLKYLFAKWTAPEFRFAPGCRITFIASWIQPASMLLAPITVLLGRSIAFTTWRVGDDERSLSRCSFSGASMVRWGRALRSMFGVSGLKRAAEERCLAGILCLKRPRTRRRASC